jgi:hypothetical protein
MNSLEDYMLKVRDCLNLIVRDWQKALKGTAENLVIINNDREDTIKVDSNKNRLLYTIQGIAEGIKIKEEDSDDIITDLGVKLDKRFDLNSKDESDFDNAIDGDEDIKDKNM